MGHAVRPAVSYGRWLGKKHPNVMLPNAPGPFGSPGQTAKDR
jgi:hypothetical protein